VHSVKKKRKQKDGVTSHNFDVKVAERGRESSGAGILATIGEATVFFSSGRSWRCSCKINDVFLKDGVLVDCVVLEVEFTPLGLCTLWPGELKLEDGTYRLFGTLYGLLMDCYGRVLYRLFI